MRPYSRSCLCWVNDFIGDGDQLATVDVSTGAVTTIGSIDVDLWGIAFAPNGTLYGIGDANAGNANDLYTISTSTGAATLITQIDGAALTAIGFGPDGTLYGAGDDAAGTELLTIGSTTGAAALVGSIAPVDAFGGARSLAFVDGMLFTNGIGDQLLAVNVVTGLGTLVGDSGTQSALQGLATPDGATLYGVTYAPGETSNSLYTLSTSTGVASFVLNFDGPFQPVAQVSWPDGHSR